MGKISKKEVKKVNKEKINKKDKVYKILTWILNAFMMIGTIFILIYFIKEKDYSRVYTGALIYLVIFLPCLLEKTKYKFNAKYKFIYSVFVLLGDFLGSIVNLYKYLWWFDLFVHFLSGVLTVVGAYYILERSKYKNISGFIEFIYVIGFVTLIGMSWEIIEYTMDVVFKLNLQHSIETGVADTMEDMIIALVGGIIGYLCYKKKKH